MMTLSKEIMIFFIATLFTKASIQCPNDYSEYMDGTTAVTLFENSNIPLSGYAYCFKNFTHSDTVPTKFNNLNNHTQADNFCKSLADVKSIDSSKSLPVSATLPIIFHGAMGTWLSSSNVLPAETSWLGLKLNKTKGVNGKYEWSTDSEKWNWDAQVSDAGKECVAFTKSTGVWGSTNCESVGKGVVCMLIYEQIVVTTTAAPTTAAGSVVTATTTTTAAPTTVGITTKAVVLTTSSTSSSTTTLIKTTTTTSTTTKSSPELLEQKKNLTKSEIVAAATNGTTPIFTSKASKRSKTKNQQQFSSFAIAMIILGIFGLVVVVSMSIQWYMKNPKNLRTKDLEKLEQQSKNANGLPSGTTAYSKNIDPNGLPSVEYTPSSSKTLPIHGVEKLGLNSKSLGVGRVYQGPAASGPAVKYFPTTGGVPKKSNLKSDITVSDKLNNIMPSFKLGDRVQLLKKYQNLNQDGSTVSIYAGENGVVIGAPKNSGEMIVVQKRNPEYVYGVRFDKFSYVIRQVWESDLDFIAYPDIGHDGKQ